MFSSKKSPKSLGEMDSAMPFPFLRSLIYNTFREVQLVASHNLGMKLFSVPVGQNELRWSLGTSATRRLFMIWDAKKRHLHLPTVMGWRSTPSVVQSGLSSVNLSKKPTATTNVFRVDEFWFWWDGCYSFLRDLWCISLYMGSSIVILNSAAPNEHTVGDTPKWRDQWSSVDERYILDHWVNTQWSFWDAHNFGRQLYMIYV